MLFSSAKQSSAKQMMFAAFQLICKFFTPMCGEGWSSPYGAARCNVKCEARVAYPLGERKARCIHHELHLPACQNTRHILMALVNGWASAMNMFSARNVRASIYSSLGGDSKATPPKKVDTSVRQQFCCSVCPSASACNSYSAEGLRHRG